LVAKKGLLVSEKERDAQDRTEYVSLDRADDVIDGMTAKNKRRRWARCFAPPLEYGKRKNKEIRSDLKVGDYKENRRSRAT